MLVLTRYNQGFILITLCFLTIMNTLLTCCESFSVSSSPTSSTTKNSPILTISDENSSDEPKFDIGCVANPVILPPNLDCPHNNGEWQCYYYGNAGSWNGGRKCFLPTGSSGLATSQDGLVWTKVIGQNHEDGSILSPSDDGSGKWDEVQTGVGDVVRINDETNELHMYYFGGSDEELSFGPGSIAGFRMRIGRAKSNDNGRTWVKDDGYLLDYDEGEGLFASWPRIVKFDDGKPWIMYYHCLDGKKWRVYHAESTDNGDTWDRKGLVLEGGTQEEDFDFAGIGTRSVVKWKNGLLMIYEGVDKASIHRLGAAFSEDGKSWSKLNDGKPILEPFKGPMGEWTKQVIGTPFAVNMPDGSLRVYHCAKDGPQGQMKIGVVVSESGEIEPECWTAFEKKESDL